MIRVRNSIFETNSSSTHSLVVAKNHPSEFPEKIDFYLGEYGWEFDTVSAPSYFYTAIYSLSDYCELDFESMVSKLKAILDSYNIEYYFEDPSDNKYAYIDHANELFDFVNYMLDNPDKLLEFLCFGEVYTGNDNDYTEISIPDSYKEIYEKGN